MYVRPRPDELFCAAGESELPELARSRRGQKDLGRPARFTRPPAVVRARSRREHGRARWNIAISNRDGSFCVLVAPEPELRLAHRHGDVLCQGFLRLRVEVRGGDWNRSY